MSILLTVPELIGALVQYFIANELLDAQKDARERLGAIAKDAMMKAKEHFAEFMILRDYDQVVYDELKSGLVDYEICQTNIDRGGLTGRFQQGDLIRQTAFGYSRYNCGSREGAIMDALSAALISSGELEATAYDYEETIQDVYKAHRLTTLSTSGAFGEFNPAQAFGSVASYMTKLDSVLTSASGSSLFGLGYKLKNIFNQRKTTGHSDSQSQTDGGGGSKAASRREFRESFQQPSPFVNVHSNPQTNTVRDVTQDR